MFVARKKMPGGNRMSDRGCRDISSVWFETCFWRENDQWHHHSWNCHHNRSLFLCKDNGPLSRTTSMKPSVLQDCN